MRRVVWMVSLLVASPSIAQPPAPPSPSITTAAAVTPAHPLDRFKDFAKYPPETLSIVDSYRSATMWLGRMHQVHGRFLPGLDPALATKIDADDDATQAIACLALCQSARLIPDPATTAKAYQAILAVSKRGKPFSPEQSLAHAAAFSLALRELPDPDPKLLADAEYYLKCDPIPKGPVSYTVPYPGAGLTMEAVAASARTVPEPWKSELLIKTAGGYRAALLNAEKSRKEVPVVPVSVVAVGVLLPGLVDGYFVTKDQTLARTAFELADAICDAQYTPKDTTVSSKWAGGFRGPDEPGYEVAIVARGLAAMTRFTRRNTTDTARIVKYRQATLNALAFVQSLQYTDDNTTHFEAKYRSQFLLGGMRTGVSNPVLRVEATAWAALAYAAYLESGAEGRE
jgi:hypothetical protein